ncbi:DUF3304 domain-containing protein [Noviherbaspirillum cavernae]|uniref:DUF3304 domain-containing protein n=1 Tax=Noviherbaspirillum cavernae TaxID=2320862 RepID=A0A418X5I2_9BURK|nr:DUF3304 domain-containing protein [Noviherbaspirillum cavernae]RJG07631.1 DUF3304 domain-containing protein [Noviherbaspirillum cavernae]
MKKTSIRLARQVLLVISLSTMLAACSVIGPQKEVRSGVGVHPLNYSGQELSYLAVEDPQNPNNAGGGAALNPYGGGRTTMCCFGIPSKWRPDLQVIVKFRVYPEKETHRILVNVPRYSKPDDIWIMVHEGGEAEAVISDTEPGHPDWPGKMKNWPEPSREYRLKVWRRKVDEHRAYITEGTQRMNSLTFESYTKEAKERLRKNLEYSKAELDYLLKNKP